MKGFDYRCILCGISWNKAVSILKNSVLEDKGVIILNNKYGVKCGTPLRFWENKSWINNIELYGWF